MTVKELIKELKKLPQDAVVMYRHNKHGRIDIDEITHSEETLLFGKKVNTVTLAGKVEE